MESSLHISDRVRCLSLLPLEDNRDAIVVGTDSHLIVYDAHDNITLFQREVPDGVNCIAVRQYLLVIRSNRFQNREQKTRKDNNRSIP